MAKPVKQQYLDNYDKEHALTMKVLRAYPKDKADLRPHPKLKTARELAFVFAMERGLSMRVYNDDLAKGVSGKPPEAPATWDEVLAAVEKMHGDFRKVIEAASDADLEKKVHFFVAPKTMGEMSRIDFLNFILGDQIHHRGQFSIYLRMADGKVPSIYGPTADEPWF
jgi:uncharacterized damage-inducible protein DinB